MSDSGRAPVQVFGGLLLLLALAFLASLAFGSVSIPFATVLDLLLEGGDESALGRIVWNIRLPKALTAILAGAALSVAGLQMQTVFRNPLADPFVIGVNSGASLGVALVLLAFGSAGTTMLAGLAFSGNFALVVAATLGAGSVLALVLLLSIRVDLTTLLILGLMIGYAASALVSILMFFALPERLQAFFSWTYGSFGTVSWTEMQAFAPAILLGLLMIAFTGKYMNALLLGEDYARSLGLAIGFWRFWILLSASILAGAVTGFCGPIGFLGVAVPHLCRALTRSADYRYLLPAVMLAGAVVALLADLLAQMPGHSAVLPLNAITALLGAPVIIWVLMRRGGLRLAFGS